MIYVFIFIIIEVRSDENVVISILYVFSLGIEDKFVIVKVGV